MIMKNKKNIYSYIILLLLIVSVLIGMTACSPVLTPTDTKASEETTETTETTETVEITPSIETIDDYEIYPTGERGKIEGNSPYKAEETTLWEIHDLKNDRTIATIPVPDEYKQPIRSEDLYLEPGIVLIAFSETTGDRIVLDEAQNSVYYWDKEMTYKAWLPLKEKYDKATEALSWFYMWTIQVVVEDAVTLKVDLGSGAMDYEYYKVDYPSIKTLSDLKAYLSQLFSDDMVTELMKNQRFQEVDGVLYTLMADRGSDLSRGISYYGAHKIDNEHYNFDVLVEIINIDQEPYGNVIGHEYVSFPLEETDKVLRFKSLRLLY